jgi:glycosyltransferase involved in cell wall biosynthesis
LKIVVVYRFAKLSPRVQLEIKTLAEEGYLVKVLRWDMGNVVPSTIEKRKGVTVEYIRLIPLKGIKPIFYLPLLYYRLAKKLRHEDFDCLHCTESLLLPLAAFIRKRKKTKLIYDAYDMDSIRFFQYLPCLKNYMRKIFEFIENRLVTRANYVLTIDSRNGFLEKRYRRFNDNVEVLYSVPQLDVTLNPQRLKNVGKQYRGKRVIIYVGGIMERKGLIKALESIKPVKEKISNVKLLFIGPLKDSKSLAKEYIERHGLVDNIEFIDWLPYEEMLYYLEVAELGLALYQPIGHHKVAGKGQGRKFFTYMETSLPIVGPEFGVLGQVVREEKCGILVDTTNSRQIADAIMYLLDHPEEAKTMGERGRKAIEEKYNWEIEKEKLLKAYREMEHEIDGKNE